MSVFPDCTFSLELEGGALFPGRPNRGRLGLHLPSPIRRAERIEVVLRGSAWATYGSGKSRRTHRHTFVDLPLALDLPEGGLAEGTHHFPFVLDVPLDLPQTYSGSRCGASTSLEVRLDVEWALDPTASVPLLLLAQPGPPTVPAPVALRSHPTFHDRIAVEVTLASSVVAKGSPIVGSLALRAGHTETIAGVSLVLGHTARIVFGHGDLRSVEAGRVAFDVDALRSGATVRFELPTHDLPFDQLTFVLETSSYLAVEVDPGLLSSTRRMPIPIAIRPPGTPLVGEVRAPLLGSERLRELSVRLARELGLAVGTGPALVAGRDGAVSFTVEDGARGASFGAVVALRTPALGLGLRSRAAGVFARPTEETPTALRDRWVVRAEPESPHVLPAHARALLEVACGGLEGAEILGISDAGFVFRVPLASDELEAWRAIVVATMARARTVSEALLAMPFVTPGTAEAAWRATAREESASLVPHLPSLSGLTRVVRTLTGEIRTFVATIATHASAEGTTTHLDVHVAEVELPTTLSDGDPHLLAVRALFPEIERAGSHLLSASRPGAVSDPRSLLPALDAVVRWALEARGERRVDAPYR